MDLGALLCGGAGRIARVAADPFPVPPENAAGSSDAAFSALYATRVAVEVEMEVV
jgi:hypothetical protein